MAAQYQLLSGEAPRQTVSLQPGKPYVLSGYINTMAMTSGSLTLYIADDSGKIRAESTPVDYRTKAAIENGWERSSVSYTPSATGTYRVGVMAKGDAAYTPATEAGDTGPYADRAFALVGTFNYSDGTKEEHRICFNSDYEGWQYTSGALVPKRADAVITSVTVEAVYDHNVNRAYFDQISLRQEPVQTYSYDADGKLVDAKSSGNARTACEYYPGTHLLKTYTDMTGVTTSLTYEDNTHNILTSTSGGLKVTNTYTGSSISGGGSGARTGAVYSSKTQGTSGGKYLLTESTYTAGNEQLRSATDSSGITNSYVYSGRRLISEQTGMAAAVTYTYDTASDRMLTASTGSGNGQISVTAEYTNGYLTGVARTAAGTDDQRYGYILDAFGNGTQICVQRKKNGGWGSPLILASYTYDSLNRLSSIGGGVYAKTFGYRDINGSRTTLQVSSLTYTGIGTGGASRSFSHTYDGNGNLSSETDGSGTRSYTYDSTNRLTGITGPGGTAESYSYDGAGNLTYAVRRSGSESSTVSHTYSYSNLRWSDLLTAYDGQAIAYEGQNYAAATGTVTGEAVSGNPISYYNGRRFSLDWEKGSQLSQAQCGSTAVTYGYDINGVRNHKTVGGTSYTYTTQNGQIVRQESGSTILDIIYDQNCAPYAIRYSADGGSTFATFYYILNLQGDVTELVDENGSTAASYSYDAWGKPLAVQNGTGAIAGSGDIARINPLRYRGYCYDEETGFYYLKSRYYDPETARFINADSAEYTGLSADSLEDTNLFAYCYNNPVMGMDPDGTLSNGWKLAITGTILVASVAVIVATGGVASGPVMCAAISAAEGAITGAAGGAAKGAAVAAATSAVKHRIATGSWKGAGKAAVKAAKQGAIDGAFKGAISGAIKGALRPTHCFVAGTVVLAADGSIAIEQIRKGDLVWSWDEETGNVALKEVVETYENETQELIHLKAGQERIDTTPNHPFYVYEKGWYAAEELRAGDILVTVNGEKVVLELVQHEILESPVKVYNLEVQDYHTYYVSDENVLVHNDCADKISKPKKRRGRSGKQARLRELANDDKLPRHLRAEIQRDIDLIKKGQRKTIRVPKGYELAHRIGYEAKKGYGYKYADLQPILIHRLQHRVMGK